MQPIERIKALVRAYNKNNKIREFVRFCLVGGLCTLIDISIFYLFLLYTSYQISLICGYCLSLIVNYYLTIYWTFQKKANAKNAIGMISAHMFNLFVVRMGLMFLFVDCLLINEQIAYIPTFLISILTNFLIVRFVVTRF